MPADRVADAGMADEAGITDRIDPSIRVGYRADHRWVKEVRMFVAHIGTEHSMSPALDLPYLGAERRG